MFIFRELGNAAEVPREKSVHFVCEMLEPICSKEK